MCGWMIFLSIGRREVLFHSIISRTNDEKHTTEREKNVSPTVFDCRFTHMVQTIFLTLVRASDSLRWRWPEWCAWASEWERTSSLNRVRTATYAVECSEHYSMGQTYEFYCFILVKYKSFGWILNSAWRTFPNLCTTYCIKHGLWTCFS